ncbi:YihY/virulence factor BrkB family protein [Streptomyces sp. SP18CS02]|uniref:YihY/virulence factor BrkB family protein n=1 Tax=Streptomyces sp. SP18CS02 TaxID=3002531 RepID=UPI002E779FEF|nr:YihY/virulence factor BrkB family protein [Streptomyces sp. SP18CS02]MEE1755251.1 YihY/virulence factor BrkB family protein [Streptomyces sp. SP18CS02]
MTIGVPASASASGRRRERGAYARALARTPVAVWEDDLTDWAAALTYYAVLAVFPALLVLVFSIALIGTGSPQEALAQLGAFVPKAARPVLAEALGNPRNEPSVRWVLVVVTAGAALWSSSSYLAVFRRALHAMHGVPDCRPAWRTFPAIVLRALAVLALLVSGVLTLTATERVARAIGRGTGTDHQAALVWSGLKWPLLLAVVVALVLLLFRSGPPEARGVRQTVAGGTLAVLLWLLASMGFAFYAAHIATYDRLYGSLAGVVAFLVWLWVSHVVLLAGAQFNAELARDGRPKRPDPCSSAA